MKKFLLCMIMLLFIGMNQALAQTRTISGKVTSAANGTPLPGVNIVLKGTTNGTATGANGKYSLQVPEKGGTLIFSFLGFKSISKRIGSDKTINVAMKAATQKLNNVVVMGYGTQSKKFVTGSVGSISTQSIKNVPTQSFETAMQGKMAGVQIESGSGKVGQGIMIRIRGSSSVTASDQPLYVIDGIPVTSASQTRSGNDPTNPLASLNYDDIASIEVLKDASATAIYGARGSNGVVLITTKQGKAGKTRININAYAGFGHPDHLMKWLNAKQYVNLYMEAARNSQKIDPSFNYVGYVKQHFNVWSDGTNWQNYAVNTNWQNHIFQTAYQRSLDVSASGGNAKTRYFVSGAYTHQDGILINNAFSRISGRLNLDAQATKQLSYGVHLSLSRTGNNRVSNDDAFSTPMQLVAQIPISPVIDPRTGQLNKNTLYYNGLISAKYSSDHTITFNNLSNAYAEYDFSSHLFFKSEFGLDLININENYYAGNQTIGNPTGFGRSRHVTALNYTTNNFFTFQQSIGKIQRIKVTAGMSFQKFTRGLSNIEAQGFPNDQFKRIASASNITYGTSAGTGYSYLSYFARANYRLKNTYLVSASAREDGSSRFGVNNRYGFFPAASIGWIATNNPFFRQIKQLTNLKFRMSYGLTGNSGIGNFDSRGLYEGTNYAGVSGIRPTQIVSPNLKWETTAQLDLGLNFGLFDNRIRGTFDYYVKHTHNLLLNVNIPETTGFNQITENLGRLINRGIGITVNTINLDGPFRWTSNIDFSHNQNKITYLGGQIITDPQTASNRTPNVAMQGEPIGVFYMVKYAGVDPKNGNALYYVKAGSNQTTSNYNKAQRQIVGNPNPEFTGGITNDFNYKGFDLNVFFDFSYGNDVYNAGGIFQSVNANYFDNQTINQLKAWQKPGDHTNVPQARLFMGNGAQPSSRWVYNASYLRLKTLTLSYTLPHQLIAKFHMRKLRVYVMGRNLLTFTKYPGWDPEVSSNTQSNIFFGSDFYTAPHARIFTAGVNIGL